MDHMEALKIVGGGGGPSLLMPGPPMLFPMSSRLPESRSSQDQASLMKKYTRCISPSVRNSKIQDA